MADTGIFATTAEVQRKVGENASTTANTDTYINDFMTQAESFINCATRYNWSDAYAGLDADVKGILKEAASNLAAAYVIQYDMFGYSTLDEAQVMLDFLLTRVEQCISILRDKKTQDFINGA